MFSATYDSSAYIPSIASNGLILQWKLQVGFDEVNDPATQGETVALREVFGLGRFALRRYRYNARTSYLVVE